MNKTLLIAAASLLMASGATAHNLVRKISTVHNASAQTEQPAVAASRAATADGYEIKYCANPYNASVLYDTDGVDYQCFISVPAEVATSLAGNKLTEVSYCMARTANTELMGNIFVSEDLNADPVAYQEIEIENGYDSKSGTFDFRTATFDEPYTIKENTPFLFGFTAKNCKYGVDYPIGYDGQAANPFAGYVAAYYNGELVDVFDMVNDFGSNLTVYATTIGEKKAVENIFVINSAAFAGNYTLPIFKDEGETLPKVSLSISNYGDNKLSKMEYTYAIDDQEPVTANATLNIPAMKTRTTSFAIANPVMTPGRHRVNITVNTINGIEVGETTSTSYVCLVDGGYKRVVFVEEGTGTGCGWCPRGIVGMETMAKEHPSDDYIGVAVHCDWFGTDPLTVESYQPFMYNYFEGLPAAIINRDPKFSLDPSAATLESKYQVWAKERTLAQLQITDAEYSVADDVVNVSVSTNFNFDEADADYRLSFILKEDGLKAVQTNYYAKSYGQGQKLEGWDDKGANVAWTYSETARDIFDVWGIEGSIPANIVAGEKYTYTYPVSLRNLYVGNKLSQQGNIEDTSIVAILIDGETGTVLQATTISADQYKFAGISDIAADDTNAPIEYYNLQGMRMSGSDMPAGIYIVKQGQTIRKQLIK